jgi:iron transport multicopper oxidase
MLVPGGAPIPPFPQSAIVNEGGDGHIPFVKGKTYRVRFISFAAFASAFLHFDSHTMSIIMIDGSYVKTESTYQIRLAPAQRYDFLITASSRDQRNYPFLIALDINRDYTTAGSTYPNNFTGQLVMDSTKAFTTDVVTSFSPQDDAKLVPYDGAAAYGPVTKTLTMNFAFCTDANNIPR